MQVSDARRKVLLGILPYLVQTAARVGSFAKVDFDFAAMGLEDRVVEDVLEHLRHRVNIVRTDEGALVSMDTDLLMEFVEEYLRNEYAVEGGAAGKLTKVDEKIGPLGIMAAMKLPQRYVYVALTNAPVEDVLLERLVEELAPSHLYVLTTWPTAKELLSSPKFVGENKVLWGRIRFLEVSKLLQLTAKLEGTAEFQLSPGRITFSMKTLY